jgi:hypothetical protein
MKIKLFLPVALLLISLFSCKKETALTKTQMLSGEGSKTWVLTAATVDPPYPISGTTVTNYFTQLPKCQQDDEYTFTASYYIDRDAGVKCGGPQINAQGDWSFGSNETKLLIGSKTFPISELTNTKLAFTQTFADKGITFTVTWVYSPQ